MALNNAIGVLLFLPALVVGTWYGLKFCDWIHAVRYEWKKNRNPSPSAQGRADAPSVSMTTYIIRPNPSVNERVARRAYMAEVEEMMQDISWRYAEREGA